MSFKRVRGDTNQGDGIITDKPENFETRNDIRLIVFKNKETDKVTNAVYMSIINDGELTDLSKIQYKKRQ